jgi:hypothetical protein
MSRVLPILVLVAGVVSTADAAPKKKHKKDDRRPTKSTKSNMPRGFVWPPSASMELAADACQTQLDELGVSYKPAKPTGRVLRPVTVEGAIGGITYTPVYSKHQVFDCELVLTLATFAPQLYELGVREVRFGSAFRNTKVRVRGKTKNILSRHALGIALDIVAFVDADGREANVERHYKRGDDLLLGVERAVNDSGQFRILLTPRNDPKSHYDHFHLEANPDYTQLTAEKPAS